jgi:hypothetical protein
MPEISEGQHPLPVEQGNTSPVRPENAQNQKADSRPNEALDKLEKGDVIGYMDEENRKYFRENAEPPSPNYSSA